ncbi:MAG TPA: phosphoribosylformylglycinamidine synthase subunit PurQ [Alphaproteobacteria bacterium]|nr:phosphoribosylformylglycinamidine synthase subunit PurQ [Alphaproteobacteria bacterium]
MKSAVIVFPGSNRENDVADAIERSSGKRPALVWHRDSELPDVDLIVLPGGFSYGDYLRTGAIAARAPVMQEVIRRADKGTAVLGICNGFQILCESGLLPGILLRNASLKFVCRHVGLKVETSQSLFTHRYQAGEVLSVPVAHGDGNYFADPATLDRLESEGRVAFRYCSRDGDLTPEANPNGSARNIAGIFNPTKNVLGLMPHPENATDKLLGSTSGKALFDGLVDSLA